MAKQYKVKDINNNGKIDGWEQGKYDAINNSATKMYKKEKSPMNNYKKGYYSMKMGSKEINSPTNFSYKSAMMMAESPMYKMTEPNTFELTDVTKNQGDIFDQAQENAPTYTVTNSNETDTSGYSALGENLGGLFKSKEERFGKNSDVVKQKQAVRAQRERIKANRLKNRANRLKNK